MCRDLAQALGRVRTPADAEREAARIQPIISRQKALTDELAAMKFEVPAEECLLELEADWILFLDADMTHTPDLISCLVRDAIKSRSAIVSASYYKKQAPHACVSSLNRHPGDPQLLTPIDTKEKGLVDSGAQKWGTKG